MLNYEINRKTLAIIPINSKKTKIIEEDNIFIIDKNSMKIIDYGCRFFGSSYEGRVRGTKNLLKINSKIPIIVEESSRLIFFPTESPRNEKCIWISLNKINDYEQEDKNISIIKFTCGKEIKINVSYQILDNQILRATRLEIIILKRLEKMHKNRNFF